MRRLAPALLLLLAGCASLAPPGPGSIAFGLIGDVPYHGWEIGALDRMIDGMNAQDLAFVLHVGDIGEPPEVCTDEWLQARRRQLERSRHPVVIVPGDNEWVDCHASADPLARLERFRDVFESGDTSLGARTIHLERQSSDARFAEYRENVRFVAAGVLFVGLNVPGSNNNLGRTPAMDAEHDRRMAAVFDWLDEAVKTVEQRNLRGLVIFVQADPDFERRLQRKTGVPDGFERFRNVLRTHALWLKKPVLLLHGDKHVYVHDQPLDDPAGRTIRNFTRVETFGSPQVRWVKLWVDPSYAGVFRVAPAPGP
jgi:hypothetical protein